MYIVLVREDQYEEYSKQFDSLEDAQVFAEYIKGLPPERVQIAQVVESWTNPEISSPAP